MTKVRRGSHQKNTDLEATANVGVACVFSATNTQYHRAEYVDLEPRTRPCLCADKVLYSGHSKKKTRKLTEKTMLTHVLCVLEETVLVEQTRICEQKVSIC